jgi:hypothetical protein
MAKASIQEILARWDSNEGKPYKGSLIDQASYEADPESISCFCAQGQVLHLFGGWDADRLRSVGQSTADKETAALLNISRAHSILLRNVNDKLDGAPSIVLTDPAKVLGDQWSKLLDFWWHLDGMTAEQWAAAWDAARAAAWDAARAAAWDAARAAAWDAAWTAAWDAARAAAWDAARAAAWDAARAAAWAAAAYAGGEIMGARVLANEGKALFFLPMFGFASPDDIPARPADYGLGVVPAAQVSA